LRLFAAIPLLVFSGCSGNRDVLDPASSEAAHIGSLWWLYCSVCGVVLALVLLAVLGAITRARRQRVLPAEVAPVVRHSNDPADRGIYRVVTGCTIATTLILFVLLFFDFSTGRAMSLADANPPLAIKITGHQWWWEIEYEDPTPSNTIVTANELHLPVGRPIQLLLQSGDVIHSFWIPNLQGKKDLVPGHPTTLWLHPDRVGTYHGQCAEFCGLQHAHMGLLAVVESPQMFAKWQEQQRKDAPEPKTDAQKRGRDVFLTTSCAMCHTIQGTSAGSRVGPPLTHIASQQLIGANSFPNRRGYLAGWIVDPQSMKPGVRMPQNSLSGDDLNALLDYLETLQ
jgi:cytochrome c oxidase subunit 2